MGAGYLLNPRQVESTKTSENASTHAGAPTMAPALTRTKAVENRTISLTAPSVVAVSLPAQNVGTARTARADYMINKPALSGPYQSSSDAP
jgi:hypothetical protein